uniref:RNase H type-1 domain-containing protein n=1 Tax=Cannabis sativa TaxID=3483 RepID=A0A803QWQ7_CANSA
MRFREALSWMKDHKWHHVVLATNCLTVVQVLRSSSRMIFTFGQVINNCKQLLCDLRNIAIFFVK